MEIAVSVRKYGALLDDQESTVNTRVSALAATVVLLGGITAAPSAQPMSSESARVSPFF